MIRKPSGCRRGYSLIEMLVAMFVFTALLGICMALVELLLKLDDRGQAHAEALATTARLARTFRADVHAALRAETPDGATAPIDRLTLAGPDGRTVDYRIVKGALIRTEREAGVFRQNDRFPLPTRAGRIAVESEGDRTMVAILFDHRSARNRGESRELRVAAALGTDHRFADADEGDQ